MTIYGLEKCKTCSPKIVLMWKPMRDDIWWIDFPLSRRERIWLCWAAVRDFIVICGWIMIKIVSIYIYDNFDIVK